MDYRERARAKFQSKQAANPPHSKTKTAPKKPAKKEAEEPQFDPKKAELLKTKEPIAYYDFNLQKFWRRTSEGTYAIFNETSLRRILKYQTYNWITHDKTCAVYCDRHLMGIQEENYVHWAGELAGFKPGFYEISKRRILVTAGPSLIVPKAGKFPTVMKFISELFGDEANRVFAWLKASLKSLYAGFPFRPAPMLSIAGPADCGKSLFQNLVTEILGGRSAKPYSYLTGQTDFNSDLMSSEHLMIEDDADQTELRFRKHFGSQLKNLAFNETQRRHQKIKDAASVSVFSRVTITMNDEPENLAVMPIIDKSLRDKIILLRAFRATFPYGPEDLDGRKKYREQLTSELPAFLHWLRSFRVPERMQNRRTGVAGWQDPGLMEELLLATPELALLDLIDRHKPWGFDFQPFEGTANDLRSILFTKDRSGIAQDLLKWHNATGTYLARLVEHFPKRFSKGEKKNSQTIWKILPRSEE